MFSLISIAAAALQTSTPAWVEFDRRQSGWGESPFEYEAASLRRRGARVTATYRYIVFTSGVPDYRSRVRLKIDCARWRARPLYSLLYGGIYALARREPRHEPVSSIALPIARGSVEEALARRLCPGASAATP